MDDWPARPPNAGFDIVRVGKPGIVENQVDTRLLQPARLEAGVMNDDTATAEEIVAHCRANLAAYKCPRFVVFEEIPKTSTGKIQKFALRETARGI